MRQRGSGIFLFFVCAVLFSSGFCSPLWADLELVGKEGVLLSRGITDWQILMDGMLRSSYNNLGYVQTLDCKRKDDLQDYMGYQYYFGFDVKFKDEYEGYIKFSSLTADRSEAPLFPQRNIHTLYGDVKAYRKEYLLPQLQEWWLDVPLGYSDIRVRAGLFPYSVGVGIALGGYYEKYGVNLYSETDKLSWRLHFDVPDVENKWHVGPRTLADEEFFGFRYDSRAWFFAGDMTVKLKEFECQPYLGILLDRTPWWKRSSPYAIPVDEDYLGTYGANFKTHFGDLSLEAEGAANFGKAWSRDPEIIDLEHAGFFFMGGASYSFFEEKIVPRVRCYYASGDKFVGDDITDGQLIKGRSRAFAVYSPTNSNLSDSHYPAFEDGPYVFMGMGSSLNEGILRPSTFADPYQMSNLIAPNVGVDLALTDKFTVNLDYWYLRTAEPPVGALLNPDTGLFDPYTLPTCLGNEFDIYAEYAVNDYITLSALGGIFLPGKYFRQQRDDGDVLGVISAPRFDGGASNAWLVEMAVTYSY